MGYDRWVVAPTDEMVAPYYGCDVSVVLIIIQQQVMRRGIQEMILCIIHSLYDDRLIER